MRTEKSAREQIGSVVEEDPITTTTTATTETGGNDKLAISIQIVPIVGTSAHSILIRRTLEETCVGIITTLEEAMATTTVVEAVETFVEIITILEAVTEVTTTITAMDLVIIIPIITITKPKWQRPAKPEWFIPEWELI